MEGVNFKFIFLIFIYFGITFLEKKYSQVSEDRNIITHDISNILVGVLNIVIISNVILKYNKNFIEILEMNKIGIFNYFSVNPIIEFIITFVILDLWMYFWHRLNHKIKFLWKFHRVHHTDNSMNVSTSLRFHPIEFLLSFLVKMPLFLILGTNMIYLIIYEIVLNIVVYFHHSNIKITRRLDKILNYIIVSPNMHRVHHSIDYKENNSNFSSVFSYNDRIFRTFKKIRNGKIMFGVHEFTKEKWQSFFNMLITPLKKD